MEKKGICPLCGNENKCASVTKEDVTKCWCMEIKVPKELLAKVPKENKNKECICKNCIEKHIRGKV